MRMQSGNKYRSIDNLVFKDYVDMLEPTVLRLTLNTRTIMTTTRGQSLDLDRSNENSPTFDKSLLPTNCVRRNATIVQQHKNQYSFSFKC